MPKRTFFRLDEDKRERVIRSAIREFQEAGYEKAKISSIAKNAEVASGSIYQYFDDKKELFLFCVNWTIEHFMKRIDTMTPLADMDVFDYFTTGIRERAGILQSEPDLVKFSQNIMNGKYAFLTNEIENGLAQVEDEYIPQLIENGKKKGTVRTDVDSRMLCLFFKGAILKIEEDLFHRAEENNFNFTGEQAAEFEHRLAALVSL